MNKLSEQIIHKLKHYTDFALPIVALLFVLVLTPVQLIPSIKSILTLQNDLRSVSERKIILENKEKFLSIANQEKLTASVEKINRLIPTTKDIPSIFAGVGVLAQKNSVNLDSVQINAGEITVPFGTTNTAVEFHLVIRGSQGQINSFLKDIPSASRFFRIKSFTIRQSGYTSDNNELVGSLVMYAYFQPLPENMGKIDEPISPLTSQEEIITSSINENNIPLKSLPEMPSGKANPFSRF